MKAGIFPGQILTAELRKSILEGHLSSLQLPRLALNCFLSVPQEHQGQASSAPVGCSPRKTQTPGAACQNQTGGPGAPPPTQGTGPLPNPSSPRPARPSGFCPFCPGQARSACSNSPENPQRRVAEVTHMSQHFIPFSKELGFEEISLKFPVSFPETLDSRSRAMGRF